jgi:hypothetical protein
MNADGQAGTDGDHGWGGGGGGGAGGHSVGIWCDGTQTITEITVTKGAAGAGGASLGAPGEDGIAVDERGCGL